MTTAKRIVDTLIQNLRGRRGLRSAFDGMDAEVRDEIKADWALLVAQELSNPWPPDLEVRMASIGWEPGFLSPETWAIMELERQVAVADPPEGVPLVHEWVLVGNIPGCKHCHRAEHMINPQKGDECPRRLRDTLDTLLALYSEFPRVPSPSEGNRP